METLIDFGDTGMEKVQLAKEGGTLVIPNTRRSTGRSPIPTSTPRGGDPKTEHRLDQEELSEIEIYEILREAEQPDGSFDL